MLLNVSEAQLAIEDCDCLVCGSATWWPCGDFVTQAASSSGAGTHTSSQEVGAMHDYVSSHRSLDSVGGPLAPAPLRTVGEH